MSMLYRLFMCILLGPTVLFIQGCSTLQVEKEREISLAFSDSIQTSLGKVFETADSVESGFIVLNTGHDAFLKRTALIDAAEQAIDLQYYIWNSDKSGRLLAQRVMIAADRGVHVRLLLDDFNIGGRDDLLLVMDAHPNIEIRVYNPNAARSGMVRKMLGGLGDFGRINQRMHNKSFIVDGSVAIVGGRNIGDEYFDLNHELNFRDRDLLTAGPIVADIAESFDVYWNHERAFSIATLVGVTAESAEVKSFRKEIDRKVQQDKLHFMDKTAAFSSGAAFNTWLSSMIWAPAELVYDQALAIDDTSHNKRKRVANTLRDIAKETTAEVLIESAYLVPGDEGVALLKELTNRGVSVKALTNSLASNDLTTNHAGYARRRIALLENGAELFELRPDAKSCQSLVVGNARCSESILFGLHAKSIVFDRKAVFVGSFNLNQRSIYLNSELALIVYSPELAAIIAGDIEQNLLSENSWQVRLDDSHSLEWKGSVDGKAVHYDHEPETGFWRRFNASFFSIFPIEKYL